MPKTLRTVQPEYYSRFQCTGAQCEDSCCSGFGVAIDQGTYSKYAQCEHGELQPIFQRSLVVNQSSTSGATHAFLAAENGRCPLQDGSGLCRVQSLLGEEALSRTCATFPRAIGHVDDVCERALYLSCPEAARLALCDPEPMRFVAVDDDTPLRFGDFPETDTRATSLSGKPYESLPVVRAFVIAMLQDRTYRLWERLTIVGMFCERLDEVIRSARGADVAGLIESFERHAAAREFATALGGVLTAASFQRDFAAKVVEQLIARGAAPRRFVECWERYTQAAGQPDGLAAVDARAKQFLEQRGAMIEHYLVNFCFRTLFPFGPQKSLYNVPCSVFDAFTRLAIQYNVLRTLLGGVDAGVDGRIDVDGGVKLIQSFAKAFEHNLDYLGEVQRSLADAKLDSLAALAALIRTGPASDIAGCPPGVFEGRESGPIAIAEERPLFRLTA